MVNDTQLQSIKAIFKSSLVWMRLGAKSTTLHSCRNVASQVQCMQASSTSLHLAICTTIDVKIYIFVIIFFLL